MLFAVLFIQVQQQITSLLFHITNDIQVKKDRLEEIMDLTDKKEG